MNRTLPPVDRLALLRYARASGDDNPIHLIDEEAERAGLPGIIQHGMLTMAQLATLLTPYLSTGYIESFHTRFVGMLLLDESLRLEGEVTRIEPLPGGQRTTFTLHARTTDGRTVAKGTLTLKSEE